MTGALLGGRYELLRRIGTGGMAEVWEATDHSLGRRVAVKILHQHLAEDPTIFSRFRTEAQSAARLTHPGVVAIYDTVATGTTDAIIMELVEGEDLRSILDRRHSLAIEDAMEVAVQVSQALAAAHQAGIVHRDIKPANIMIRPDRRVKLGDFGIAKALDDTTHTESGSLVGTVKYLAPEQIQGHPVDGRTDLYALTTVLYEMICGEVPFAARDLAGAMDRISREAPHARSSRADVPVALDGFLAQGLARDPNQRPADAQTYAASLLAIRRGDTTDVHPAPVESAGPLTPLPKVPDAEPPRPRSIPMRAPAATPPSPPRSTRRRRRALSILGPLIAGGLMIAALVTVWLLLRPAGDAVSDQLRTSDSAVGVDSTTTTPRAAADPATAADDSTDSTAVADSPATTSENASSTTTSTSTSTTLAPFSSGIRIRAIDPEGDGIEHDEATDRVLDGNPDTFWYTESYDTRLFGGIKTGVGLVIEFEEPTRVEALRIRANNLDWSATLYEADRVESVLQNWGEPIERLDGLGSEVEVDGPGVTTSALLLWITDLGEGSPDENGRVRLEITELVAVT